MGAILGGLPNWSLPFTGRDFRRRPFMYRPSKRLTRKVEAYSGDILGNLRIGG